MKVVLDENLDHALRGLLSHHEVVTVSYMGWAGLKNGGLLRTAEENGFDVLLTGDRTLTCEQNLTGLRIAIVALSAIQLPIIKQHLPAIIVALNAAIPGSFQAVDCGTFTSRNERIAFSHSAGLGRLAKPESKATQPQSRRNLLPSPPVPSRFVPL